MANKIIQQKKKWLIKKKFNCYLKSHVNKYFFKKNYTCQETIIKKKKLKLWINKNFLSFSQSFLATKNNLKTQKSNPTIIRHSH